MTTPTYLGLDLETTGLDPARDRIIELGLIVYSEDLQELASWSSVVACPWQVIDRCDDVVQAMHIANGLLARQTDGTLMQNPAIDRKPPSLVEAEVCEILDGWPGGKPVLLGSSVHFDRSFLRHWMPEIERRLSHRHFEAATARFLGVPKPEGTTTHRALDDIRASAAWLRRAMGADEWRKIAIDMYEHVCSFEADRQDDQHWFGTGGFGWRMDRLEGRDA